MESVGNQQEFLTARAAGLIGCRSCGRVWPAGTALCGRCGSGVQSRDAGSLQRVWALLLAGIVFYIPANLYPMLRTTTLLDEKQSTIIGGIVDLVDHGDFGIALIVFVASAIIPLSKFMAIGFLALSIRDPRVLGGRTHLRLLEVVEFIGRWSMIDVFVVAIMSALVQLSFVASVHPGPAAVSFALSVVFTMLSAQSFDPRMIWDEPQEPTP